MNLEFPLAGTPQLRQSKNVFPGGLENSWTPVITFAVPGDIAVVYLHTSGYYLRIGSIVFCFFTIFASSVTFTTSSGSLKVTGLPYTARLNANTGGSNCYGSGNLEWLGITKANYTDAVPRPLAGQKAFEIAMSGSGQLTSAAASTNVTSGNPVNLLGMVIYQAAEET